MHEMPISDSWLKLFCLICFDWLSGMKRCHPSLIKLLVEIKQTKIFLLNRRLCTINKLTNALTSFYCRVRCDFYISRCKYGLVTKIRLDSSLYFGHLMIITQRSIRGREPKIREGQFKARNSPRCWSQTRRRKRNNLVDATFTASVKHFFSKELFSVSPVFTVVSRKGGNNAYAILVFCFFGGGRVR